MSVFYNEKNKTKQTNKKQLAAKRMGSRTRLFEFKFRLSYLLAV